MSPLDFHILLALADGPRHGYAIAESVHADSEGTLTPRPGSLYRVIARLETSGLLGETAAPADAPPHPGLERRYYTLTRSGRRALATEAQRLRDAASIAGRRLRVAEERSS